MYQFILTDAQQAPQLEDISGGVGALAGFAVLRRHLSSRATSTCFPEMFAEHLGKVGYILGYTLVNFS